MKIGILIILSFSFLTGCVVSSSNLPTPTPTPTPTPLPDISTFSTQKSDRFLVDLTDVDKGNPFRGENSVSPHGAHVEFNNPGGSKWPKGEDIPQNYVPIYAVADGNIYRVGKYELITYQDKSHYKYSIHLAFARQGDKTLSFEYSIEPMYAPADPLYYEKFILVTEGQWVKKGDLIAYLYVPAQTVFGTSHIHFDLFREEDQKFLAPAIFTHDLVLGFYDRWMSGSTERLKDGAAEIPPCMGYKISAEENPFGTGAKDTLE